MEIRKMNFYLSLLGINKTKDIHYLHNILINLAETYRSLYNKIIYVFNNNGKLTFNRQVVMHYKNNKVLYYNDKPIKNILKQVPDLDNFVSSYYKKQNDAFNLKVALVNLNTNSLIRLYFNPIKFYTLFKNDEIIIKFCKSEFGRWRVNKIYNNKLKYSFRKYLKEPVIYELQFYNPKARILLLSISIYSFLLLHLNPEMDRYIRGIVIKNKLNSNSI